MIIFGPNLYLPSTGDDSIDNPQIGYDNEVTLANLVADTADANYPATNLVNPSTSSRWQAADTTTQYLTISLANLFAVDYVGIAKHNLFSSGCTISVETQAVAAGAWVQQTTPRVPLDDSPIILRWLAASPNAVRLKMTGNSTVARIAVLYCGKILPVPRRVYVSHAPLNLSRDATVTTGRSESGNFLGRVVLREFTSTSMNLQNLDPAWYRSFMDPFVKVSKDTPFFAAWRPGSYPSEVGYCWMTNSPKPVNQRANGMMSVQLQYGGQSS